MLAALRHRLSPWPVLLGTTAIYLVSQAAIASIVHPHGADFLRVQTTLSVETVRAIFARWDAQGLMAAYAAHYRFDMIHPLWYALALASGLAKGFEANRVPASRDFVLLLPFIAGGCDVLENLIHLSFIEDRAHITQGAVWLGNGAALLKWAIALPSLVAVIALAIRAAQQRERGAA